MQTLLIFSKTEGWKRVVKRGRTSTKQFDFFLDRLPALGWTRFIQDSEEAFNMVKDDGDETEFFYN